MARVLCVNPWIYDFAAYNVWIEPLGLLAVAAALRAKGHQVGLIDCLDRHHPSAPAPRSPRDAYGCGRFQKVELRKPTALSHIPRRWGRYGLPVEVFEAALDAQPRPHAVLVTSMMTYWYPGPFEVIRRVKARWPGVPVALGGVYATLCTSHARRYSGADAVLPGPGEDRARAWVGQVCGEQETLAETKSQDGSALWPAHDLRRPQGYIALQTARGCPFCCPYCAVQSLEPGGLRRREPRAVIDELAFCVERLGIRDVAFYDDALLADAEHHIRPILEGVLKRGIRVRFHTPNGLHARYIDLALARLMRRAGFATLRLGLETSDERQQAEDGSKVDSAGFAGAATALRQAGFESRQMAAYVLVGRPGQDIAAVQETVDYAHALGVQVRAAQYSPIPGTREWEAATSVGCIAPDADPLLHNNSLYPCADRQAWEELKVEIRKRNRSLLARS
jgi:radical SAM superfamily enzyme YgiQ (UPF0313 family)